MVTQGWAEKTCTEVGVGELPQLLQYMKTHTTPTPTATPVKEEEEEPMNVGVKKEEAIVEKPIHVSFGGQTVEYRCGNCDIAPKKSKSGMDAHIQSAHKEGSVVLLLCIFYVQFRFFEQAHEGAQLEPSLCHLWAMSQLPHPLGVLFMVTRTRTGIDNFMGGSIILYFLRPFFYLWTFFRGRGVLFVTELL